MEVSMTIAIAGDGYKIGNDNQWLPNSGLWVEEYEMLNEKEG